MIFVLGTMNFRESDIPRLMPAFSRQIMASRGEPGCDHYALAVDVLTPTRIHVSERWLDQQAFAAHLVTDQMVAFNIDLRSGRIVGARVDSFHPGGDRHRLIDINNTDNRFTQGSKDMVIVMGTARLAPGELDKIGDAMKAQLEATRAEDGCEHYSFARDVLDPDLMHIAERWRDNAALTAHFAQPHMATFNAALGAANVLSVSVKAYDENGVRTLIGE